MARLQNEMVIVAGAASRIGKVIVQRFPMKVNEGAPVIAADVNTA